MSKAIAIRPEGRSWTAEQIAIIKATVAQGTTDMELALFLEVAKARGLDPFGKEIYAVMRYDSQAGCKKMVLQTGIDGYRKLAADSGEYAGQLGPLWCGPEGAWVDVWLKPEHPAAAKVGVLRKGFAEPIWCVARWDAYVQLKDGKPTKFWRDMGPEQLAKCAEAIGLRKAFPRQTSGLYTHEEMAQADRDDKGVAVANQQAVVAEKLRNYAAIDEHGAMVDIEEDPIPPAVTVARGGKVVNQTAYDALRESLTGEPTPELSIAPGATGSGSSNTVGARPAADPRLGRYLYPEQAEHLKLFAKAKKTVGEVAYRRILGHYKLDKSLQITNERDGAEVLEALRDTAKAQAHQRKVAAEKAAAESNELSLPCHRDGAGCSIPIANQIATYFKALKTPINEASMVLTTEYADRKKECPELAPQDIWNIIAVGLANLVEKRRTQ